MSTTGSPFHSLDNKKCCGCIAYLTGLKIFSVIVLMGYLTTGLLLSVFYFHAPSLVAVAVVTYVFTVFAFFYLEGLRRENDVLMIPFLVAEILSRVLFGFTLMLLWGIFALSCFNLFVFTSPIERLTPSQCLFILAILSTFVYGVYFQFLFPFYRGYRHVKKLNDRRRMYADESAYMKISFTSRPTTI